ncbi:Glycosyltransferase family 61 protein [Striga hermonthica]|uniref:Glycosyltransferase family 61 protein n=1 Tax=Striga hermonthica TaxID=68872 RepID=A0A9N7R5P3_STRHE|nr:Glycosyltransferase family 61 protein [Striga hermonthica]
MVKYQRKNLFLQWKKNKEHLVGEDEESGTVPFGLVWKSSVFSRKLAKPQFFYLVCLSLACCCLFLASILYSFGVNGDGFGAGADVNGLLCSSVPNGTICCDRTSIRTDVCVMKGDVRTHSRSSSITLYESNGPDDPILFESDGPESGPIRRERIRPYTRKWETSVMETIGELDLVVRRKSGRVHHKCDIIHDVPAVFFSTSGYTGNLYHEFNDGIVPLYITSQKFNKRVVFVILEYQNWWIMKYGDVLSQLSDFPPVDFYGDKRVHCFPEAVVGLRIHDELTIDPLKIEGNKTISDFHELLGRAYWPRIKGLIDDEEREARSKSNISVNTLATKVETRDLTKPKLVIVSRNGSRAITNEGELVRTAEDIGFEVEVIRPVKTTELAKTFRALNSCDVVVGVHGAAMTHFLFMNPGSVFIQVVPLGTDWAAENYYRGPAMRFGLMYIGYKIHLKESSLYDEYSEKDPVLSDPDSINRKGWEYTKRIYLDRQTVRLDLRRFGKRLLRAYYYALARKSGRHLGHGLQ